MSILTYETLKELLHYDPQTGIWTWIKRSSPRSHKYPGDLAGQYTLKGYLQIGINKKRYYGSRLAFLYMTGKFPDQLVDHIDGNPSNDKWENLRLVDYKQNGANRKNNCTKALPKNISKKAKNSFTVTMDGKSHNGIPCLELAELIASELRDKLFGEYARHE